MCSGFAYVSESDRRSVSLWDLRRARRMHEIAVPGIPGDLLARPEKPVLYVAIAEPDGIAEISLTDESMRIVDLPQPPTSMTDGDGLLYVTFSDWIDEDADHPLLTSPMGIIDVDTMTILNLFDVGRLGGEPIYDRHSGRLFVGANGSPAEHLRYAVDVETASVTLEQSLRGGGGNCRHFTLSPDGKHALLSCGGGEGSGYSVLDRDADNFTHVLQEYLVGPYPLASAYRPDLGRVAISNTSDVIFYDPDLGTELARVAAAPCSSNFHADMFYSPGGRYVYLGRSCAFSGATIAWLVDPLD